MFLSSRSLPGAPRVCIKFFFQLPRHGYNILEKLCRDKFVSLQILRTVNRQEWWTEAVFRQVKRKHWKVGVLDVSRKRSWCLRQAVVSYFKIPVSCWNRVLWLAPLYAWPKFKSYVVFLEIEHTLWRTSLNNHQDGSLVHAKINQGRLLTVCFMLSLSLSPRLQDYKNTVLVANTIFFQWYEYLKFPQSVRHSYGTSKEINKSETI